MSDTAAKQNLCQPNSPQKASRRSTNEIRSTTTCHLRSSPATAMLSVLCALNCGAANAALAATLSAKAVLPGQSAILTLAQTGPAGTMPTLQPLQRDFQITNRAGAAQVDSMPALQLSINARVEPARVRVRQQVILTVQVKSKGGTPTGRLHEPRILDARVLPLGEDRRAESTDGGDVQVYEQRFAVFPTEPGALHIPPLRFDAWRITGGAPVAFESDAQTVQVEPPAAPIVATAGTATDAENGDLQWLPARNMLLTEAGPETVRIAPGQALERMITLRGDGLMAEDLPVIPLLIPFQLRIREDAPRLWNERTRDGVVGYRSERILIGAAEDGTYTLAGTSINWWNTETERWEQASLPAWTLKVAAFASEGRRPAATWNQQPTVPADGDAGSMAAPTPALAASPLQTLRTQSQPWLGAVAAIVVLLLLMTLANRFRREPVNKAFFSPKPIDSPQAPVFEQLGPTAESAKSHENKQ